MAEAPHSDMDWRGAPPHSPFASGMEELAAALPSTSTAELRYRKDLLLRLKRKDDTQLRQIADGNFTSMCTGCGDGGSKGFNCKYDRRFGCEMETDATTGVAGDPYKSLLKETAARVLQLSEDERAGFYSRVISEIEKEIGDAEAMEAEDLRRIQEAEEPRRIQEARREIEKEIRDTAAKESEKLRRIQEAGPRQRARDKWSTLLSARRGARKGGRRSKKARKQNRLVKRTRKSARRDMRRRSKHRTRKPKARRQRRS